MTSKLTWKFKVVFGGRTFLRYKLDRQNTFACPSFRCCLTIKFHGLQS